MSCDHLWVKLQIKLILLLILLIIRLVDNNISYQLSALSPSPIVVQKMQTP